MIFCSMAVPRGVRPARQYVVSSASTPDLPLNLMFWISDMAACSELMLFPWVWLLRNRI